MATDIFVLVAAVPKSFWKVQQDQRIAAAPGKFIEHFPKKTKYINTLFHAIASQATAVQNIQETSRRIAMWTPKDEFGGVIQDLKNKTHTHSQGHQSLADVNIPAPLPCLVPFPGSPFSLLVTVAILGFVVAALSVAFVVVLLSIPGPVPSLPVSVITAPVVVFTVRGIVVHMIVGVIFLGFHIGRVSTLLGL